MRWSYFNAWGRKFYLHDEFSHGDYKTKEYLYLDARDRGFTTFCVYISSYCRYGYFSDGDKFFTSAEANKYDWKFGGGWNPLGFLFTEVMYHGDWIDD